MDDPGFLRHLAIAIGSANEAEQQLRLAHGMDVLGPQGTLHMNELVEIRRMMIGLHKAVVRKHQKELPEAGETEELPEE